MAALSLRWRLYIKLTAGSVHGPGHIGEYYSFRQSAYVCLIFFQVQASHQKQDQLVARGLGQLVGNSARLVIERLQVQIPAGVAGKFYFPELTLCADSYSVSVPLPCYCSGM